LVRWYKLGKVECQEIDRATGRCFGAVAAVRSSHSRCDHRRLTASTLAPKLAGNSGKRQASPFPSPLCEYFSLYLTYLYLVSSRLTPHSSLLTPHSSHSQSLPTKDERLPAKLRTACRLASAVYPFTTAIASFLPSSPIQQVQPLRSRTLSRRPSRNSRSKFPEPPANRNLRGPRE
jgi:hypothetical protein